MAQPAEPPQSERPTVLRPARIASPKWALDALIIAVLAIATFLVHNVHYILNTPFWLDESWVAVSTRLPLRDAPDVTSATPLGWTVLLRLPILAGQQGLRLVPLTFAALSVVVAYLIARSVPWRPLWWGRVAGALAGIAALLAPSSLLRNDLKQYTADAFVTLALLLLVSRIERSWTRARLMALSVACLIGFLISAVALFVAVAGFGALFIISAGRRNLSRVIEVTAFGAATALSLGWLFLSLYQPHVQKSLTQYWQAYYPPVGKGISPTMTYLHLRGAQMASYLGVGPLLLALVLVGVGVFLLARTGHPALACTAPVLVLEMFVLGAAKKYPLFDERTSHFLTVTFAVFAAVGVAGMCAFLARRQVVVGLGVAVLATALFTDNARPDIRIRSIPAEDVRTPTAYVAAHRNTSDVILLSSSSNWGFGYYWRQGQPGWRPSTVVATGFMTTFPGQPEVVVADDRTLPAIQSAVQRARAQAGERRDARIWLLRVHLSPSEDALWKTAITRAQLHLAQVLPCSLMLLTVQPDAGGAGQVNVPEPSCS